MGQPRAASRDKIDVARHIHLPDFHFLHPAVLDLPLHAHARHDGHAHAHLHEALDTFDGGHFNGHVQSGAVSREKLDHAAAIGGLDAVGDEVFVAEVLDVDFALFREDMFGRNDQSEFVLQDFGGLELRLLRDVGDGAEVEAIVKNLVRDIAGEHAMDADQDAGMQLAKGGQGGQ